MTTNNETPQNRLGTADFARAAEQRSETQTVVPADNEPIERRTTDAPV